MVTRKSLIFGISELIKVMSEEDVPADLYREIYSLQNRTDLSDERIERAANVLRKVLSDFDIPITCPKCGNPLPPCEVCLFCGHYFVVPKFDEGGESLLKPYRPFREGSQRDIVEKCFRVGMTTEQVIEKIREKYPKTQESTIVNNIYIYISTWRKQFGWEITREDGVIRLVNTHGNG